MDHRNAPRTLRSLIGHVGACYARRALPPAWILAAAAIGAGACWCWIKAPLAGAAAAAAVLGAAFRLGPHRRPWMQPPGWRSVIVLGAFALDSGKLPLNREMAEVLFSVAGSAAALCLAGAILAIGRTAYLIEQQARNLDDAELLELLPAPARHDALEWIAGENAKQQELRLVVHLAAMWLAMQRVAEPKLGGNVRLVA